MPDVNFTLQNTGSFNFPAGGDGPPVNGGNAGTLTIDLRMPNTIVTPCAIIPRVNWSQTTFDNPPAADADTNHDPTYKGFDVFWDIDEETTFDHCEQLSAANQNGARAEGFDVDFVSRIGGVRTISCLLVEKSSGKFLTASVQTPDIPQILTAIPAANQIYVNVMGDDDFSHAPAGAQTFNANEITSGGPAWTAKRAATGHAVICLKGGADFTGVSDIDVTSADAAETSIIRVGGTSGRAVLRSSQAPTGAGVLFNVAANHDPLNDIRLQGIEFVGPFDPDTNTPADTSSFDREAIGSSALGLSLTVDDCFFRGFTNSFSITNNNDDVMRLHVWGGGCTDHGGQYANFIGRFTNLQTFIGFVGYRSVQSINAISTRDLFRAAFRYNEAHAYHMRSCQVFSRDEGQPCCKFLDAAQKHGSRINVHGCYFEGGWEPITFGHNFESSFAGTSEAQDSARASGRFAGNIIVGNYSTRTFIKVYQAGIWIEGNLGILPNTSARMNAFRTFVEFEQKGTNAETRSTPGGAFSNTWVFARTLANNSTQSNSNIVPTDQDVTGFDNLEFANNLIDRQTAETPGLDRTTVLVTPYSTVGYKADAAASPIASTATPATAIKTYAPLASASTVIGQAGPGSVSTSGLNRVKRADVDASPDLGAYEYQP